MMLEWYDQIHRDIRLAGRRAVRHGTFTVAVVVCIALGIGATTSVLSVLHPVLVAPFPFEDPDELVQIGIYNVHRTDPDQRFFLAWMAVDALRRESRRLEGIAAFYQRDLDVVVEGETQRIAGAGTVPGSFAALGLRPLLGRTLHDDDLRLGRRVVVVAERFWTRSYGRDPGIVGRTLVIGGEPHQIVGVIRGDLRLTTRAEIFPVFQPRDHTAREHVAMGVFFVAGRLPSGEAASVVEGDLVGARQALVEAEPIFYADYDFEARPLREALVGDFRRPLWTLMAAAFFVFLLAAANVANLLMARAQGEVWERGLRTALGARCRRIALQGMIENGLLASLGGTIGVVIGAVGASTLLGITPLDNPAFDDAGLSAAVVLTALALSLLLAGAVSILPAVRCYSAMSLLQGGRGGVRREERRLQTGFVLAQVALSFVLLVGAGLMARSTLNLGRLDLGFETGGLVTIRASAPPSMAGTADGRTAFTAEVLERLRAVPGVQASGASSWLPFADGDVGFNHAVEDFPPESGSQRQLHPGRIVAPGYFAAMGIPLVSGRVLDGTDDARAPPVAVVSRAFERHYWGRGSAVGKRIKRGAYDMEQPWIEIVGVVEDTRSGVVSDPVRPTMYYPHAQSPGGYLAQVAYTVRSETDAEQLVPVLREAIHSVAASATVYDASTGAEIRRLALGRNRFNTVVVALFAMVGLTLAAAGIFGTTSWAVGRRTREFGLRVALGAAPMQLRRHVLGGAFGIAMAGIAIGAAGSAALMTALSELLFDVEAGDVGTYGAVAVVLAASVVIATYLPARRATRIDPTIALKND